MVPFDVPIALQLNFFSSNCHFYWSSITAQTSQLFFATNFRSTKCFVRTISIKPRILFFYFWSITYSAQLHQCFTGEIFPRVMWQELRPILCHYQRTGHCFRASIQWIYQWLASCRVFLLFVFFIFIHIWTGHSRLPSLFFVTPPNQA